MITLIMGILSKQWKLVVGAIVVLALAFAVWSFADHYYDQGVAYESARRDAIQKQIEEKLAADKKLAVELLAALTKQLREKEAEIAKFDKDIQESVDAARDTGVVVPERVLRPLRKIR